MNKHFYLCSANVTFMPEEGAVSHATLSTAIAADEPRVTVRELARAQQGVQISLFGKLGQEVQVLDVVIMSVSYLGEMTEEEFQCNAEGATVVANDQDTVQ